MKNPMAGPQAEAVWMELLRAAKQMPRATPAPGASCTEHPFTIEAAKVWDLDRSIKAVEAHAQPLQADGRGAGDSVADLSSDLGKVQTELDKAVTEIERLKALLSSADGRGAVIEAAQKIVSEWDRMCREELQTDEGLEQAIDAARAALQQSPATDNAPAVGAQDRQSQ